MKTFARVLTFLSFVLMTSAAFADDSQLETAIAACEKLSGQTLPRPPVRPTEAQMGIIHTCMNDGIDFPRPPHGPPPSQQPQSSESSGQQ